MLEFIEYNAIFFSFLFSAFAFLGMIFQNYLAIKRTNYLIKNIKYSSYLKQLDEVNIVNKLLIDPDELKTTIAKFEDYKDVNSTELAFAWLVINRYESAFKAKELGIMTNREWEVVQKRIQIDFNHEIIKKVWKRDFFGFDYDIEFKSYINGKILNI